MGVNVVFCQVRGMNVKLSDKWLRGLAYLGPIMYRHYHTCKHSAQTFRDTNKGDYN